MSRYTGAELQPQYGDNPAKRADERQARADALRAMAVASDGRPLRRADVERATRYILTGEWA